MGKLFLIYEGISGSGKSTLLTEMMHRRGFSDYALHRGPATEWVYGTIQKDRVIDMKTIRDFETRIHNVLPTVLILVECNPTVAEKRLILSGDKWVEDLPKAFELFDFYYEHVTLVQHKVRIDTNGEFQASADQLERELRDIDNAHYQSKRF